MGKEVGHKQFALSPKAADAWREIGKALGPALERIRARGIEFPQKLEDAFQLEDGDVLRVTCSIPGFLEISMLIPKEHWSYVRH